MTILENATVYNLDETSKYLLDLAYHNLDTEKGYRAYYALEKYIKDNGKDDSILYDLGAEFAPDDRLDVEVSKLARAEHRFDMISEEAMNLVGYAVKIEDSEGRVRYRLKNTKFTVNETELYLDIIQNKLFTNEDVHLECKSLEGLQRVSELNYGYTFEPFPVYVLISE